MCQHHNPHAKYPHIEYAGNYYAKRQKYWKEFKKLNAVLIKRELGKYSDKELLKRFEKWRYGGGGCGAGSGDENLRNNMTLYLWDLAETLFREKWNKELTGFASFEDYVRAKDVDFNDARAFEECYYEPYINGEMFNLRLNDGFQEVLSWTKNNETFSTGFQQQVDWRAQYLNPKVGFDIRQYFKKLNSTFDFGETNVKTLEMLEKYLADRRDGGYNTVVYTDDKLANCRLFKKAVEKVDINFRVYNIRNDNGGLRNRGWYWEVGNLRDLLENEKIASMIEVKANHGIVRILERNAGL